MRLISFGLTTAFLILQFAVPAPLSSKPEEVSDPTRMAVPTRARIQEIAGWLSAKPAGLGYPISDRTRWETLARDPAGSVFLKQAEKWIASSPPELTEELFTLYRTKGTRGEYEKPYGQRIDRVAAFALAECIENKGRFLKNLEEEIPGVLAEGTWCAPAHCGGDPRHFRGEVEPMVDLGAGARCYVLSLVSFWLGDKLSADVQRGIRREIKRRAWDGFLVRSREGDPKNYWWMKGGNNWNAVVHAGVVSSALTLLENREERAEFLAQAEIGLKYNIAGFTDDGFCDEGIGYWYYGFGHFMMLVELIRQATGGRMDYFAEPKIQRMATYPFRLEIGNDIFPAFGDGGAGTRLDYGYAGFVSRRLGVRTDILDPRIPKDTGYGHPLGAHLAKVALNFFCDDVPKLKPVFDESLTMGGQRDTFPEGGVWVFRPDPPNPKGLAIAIKGGHNAESHNHHDMGSYSLIQGGVNLLLDLGMDAYTKDTFSDKRYESEVINGYGHPVPIVKGVLQSQGLKDRGDHALLEKNHARVVRQNFSPARDELVLDLASGYTHAVSDLKKLERTFLYDRSNRTGSVTIEDRFAYDEAGTYETAMFSKVAWVPLEKGVYKVGTAQGAVKVTVTAEGGELAFATVDRLKSFGPTGFMVCQRLGIGFKDPLKNGLIRLRIEPFAAPGAVILDAEKAVEKNQGAIRIEAESFTKETGGKVEIVSGRVGASGKAFKGWDGEGHAIAWSFPVPVTGSYGLRIRYCTESPFAVRSLAVQNRKVGENVAFRFPGTGGWSSGTDDWAEAWVGEGRNPVPLWLEAGPVDIAMENGGNAMNLDWLELVPLRRFATGFTWGLVGFQDPKDGMTELAMDGSNRVLRVTDTKTDAGSALYSRRFQVKPGSEQTLTCRARSLNGEKGLALYLRYLDPSGKSLSLEGKNETMVTIDGKRDWNPWILKGRAPEGAVAVDIWIHSLNKATPTAEVDDLELTGIGF